MIWITHWKIQLFLYLSVLQSQDLLKVEERIASDVLVISYKVLTTGIGKRCFFFSALLSFIISHDPYRPGIKHYIQIAQIRSWCKILVFLVSKELFEANV